MPFKHNSARRHRIPKQKFKVTNWAEYEVGLRQRGSVTFWISEAAIAGWIAPLRKTRGGQCRYSDLAIETTLICGKVFNQPLRHCYFNESADVTYSLAHLSCGFQARDFAPHVSGGLS